MSEFTASNGFKVSRLPDGQCRIVRSTNGAYEAVTWCGPEEYKAIAEHALTQMQELEYGVHYGDDDTERWTGSLERAKAKADPRFGDYIIVRTKRFEVPAGEWEHYDEA